MPAILSHAEGLKRACEQLLGGVARLGVAAGTLSPRFSLAGTLGLAGRRPPAGEQVRWPSAGDPPVMTPGKAGLRGRTG